MKRYIFIIFTCILLFVSTHTKGQQLTVVGDLYIEDVSLVYEYYILTYYPCNIVWYTTTVGTIQQQGTTTSGGTTRNFVRVLWEDLEIARYAPLNYQCLSGCTGQNVVVAAYVAPFTPGTITPQDQWLFVGNSAETLVGTVCSGGTSTGTITYNWQQTTDINNPQWTSFGCTTKDYNPGIISQTMYYRRKDKISLVVYSVPQYSFEGYTAPVAVHLIDNTEPQTATQFPPAENLNYIKEIGVYAEGIKTRDNAIPLAIGNKLLSSSYFDGNGRLSQNVKMQYSPLQNDFVAPKVYNEYGLESRVFLPYSALGQIDGIYKSSAIVDQTGFYKTPSPKIKANFVAWSDIVFDSSPLSRTTEESFPGEPWQISDHHTKRTEYVCNGVNSKAPTNDLINFTVSSASGTTSIINSGYYPLYKFFKIIKTDENNNVRIEYFDKLNKLKCVRLQLDESNNWIDTYYLYNNREQLIYVLAPGSVSTSLIIADDSDPVFKEYVYAYQYDERGLSTASHIPGKGWTYTVYNIINQPVLIQDSKLRQSNQWLFVKYDQLGREIMKGIIAGVNSPVIANSLVKNSTVLWETRSQSTGNFNDYTDLSFPRNANYNLDVYTVNYYDDYNFTKPSGFDFAASTICNLSSYSTLTRGMLTGSKVKVLDYYPLTYHMSILYYDAYARPVQVVFQHLLGTDRKSTKYDFSGRIMATQRINSGITINSWNEYDHAGRITNINFQANNDPVVNLASFIYNEIGQLVEKRLNSPNFIDYDFRYNERGWLTSINNSSLMDNSDNDNSTANDVFGEEIYYNDQISIGNSNSTKQYNGNINAVIWKTKAPDINGTQTNRKAYRYSYDPVSRLTEAVYASENASNQLINDIGMYNEALNYDISGNITSLKRYGISGLIDDLSYTYFNSNKSNRLSAIVDAGQNNETDFQDNNTSGQDYFYDENGNLITDANKGLTITYNTLNLPKNISGTGGTITYIYNAVGTKLAKISDGGTHYYIEGIEYQGNNLLFAQTPEGRIRLNTPSGVSPAWVYDYFVKDHLGNVRVICRSNPGKLPYPVATMEPANSSVEETFYSNISETRSAKPFGADNIPGNTSMSLTNGNGNQVGPKITLQVQQGDKISLTVKSFFKYSGSNFNGVSLTQAALSLLLSTLLDPMNLTGQTLVTARDALNNQVFGSPATYQNAMTGIAPNNYPGVPNAPQAYLHWLLFDDEFNLVPASSGVQQIPNVGNSMQTTTITNITMNSSGFVMAYVSTQSIMNVWWDDFQISHLAGYEIEQNHYYPFGMLNPVLSSASTVTQPENMYKYNSKELQKELHLEWLDYGARFYDPVVGRWHSVDPLAEKYAGLSPYNYCAGNPVMLIDPDGRTPSPPSEHVDGYGNMIAHYDDNDKSVYIHKYGTTKDQVDAQRSELNNTGGSGTKIGEIGGNIDISKIMPNLLASSIGVAKQIEGLGEFADWVKGGSIWDLKSYKNTIFGVAWKYDASNNTSTTFNFGNYRKMTAADIGNYHFGYVGRYTNNGVGFNESTLWIGAGLAEIKKNIFDEGRVLIGLGRMTQLLGPKAPILPFGDRMEDFLWNTMGIIDADKSKKR